MTLWGSFKESCYWLTEGFYVGCKSLPTLIKYVIKFRHLK
nr:MAG TPA: hypothetical protein [Caudoviricetes sp.]